MTAAGLLADAAATLAAAGVDSPDWDAERLLRHVLGWDRATLIASPDRVVPEPEVERFRALLRRRAAREPLQYILGTQAFWKHDFLVTPAVLIPRPETELLVETALELVKGLEKPVIVDVGTGSGCIALSLAAERKDAEVHATDISEPALEVARENARRLGLEGRVTFHHGDLLEPVSHLAGRIDLIVSNPPYVDPADLESLSSEVRDHEPCLALVPENTTARALYGRLAREATRYLKSRSWLIVEIEASLAEGVTETCAAVGLRVSPPRRDLALRARVIAAQTR